jgi:hypothetical protein
MSKLNLPQWTETHAVLLDQEIMAVRSKMLHYQGREARGTADSEDLTALELYTGILHTLVTMRRPVGAIGIHGAPVLREIIAETLTADKRWPANAGTPRSPTYRAMRARMEATEYPCTGDCLDGVGELRSCVEWANATNEDEHDYLTAEEILERYRRVCADDPGTH